MVKVAMVIGFGLGLVGCGGYATAPGYGPMVNGGVGGGGGATASFGDVQAAILDKSCGAAGAGCHSAQVASGGLDLETDPYRALLGADGSGAQAKNGKGTARLLRVAPGEPTQSLLYLKLSIAAGLDPQYGNAMPLGRTGSVAAANVSLVHDWIAAGAHED